ncbi:MAG: hypothetical protein ACP5JJ_11365 [Anaerolineae bacterium]
MVLANQPRLLRGLLNRVLAKAPGLKVVSEELDLLKLPSTVEQNNADWVIVSLWQDGEMPYPLENLLVEHPTTCLLGMAADGSHAKIRCATRDDTALNSLSLDDLLTILRRGNR